MRVSLKFLFVFIMFLGEANAQVSRLDFSDDQNHIVFNLNDDSSLYLCRHPENNPIKLNFLGEQIKEAEFLKNSSKLILLTRNNRLLVFDAASQKVMFAFIDIYSFATSDSLLLLGNVSGEILVMRTKDFSLIKCIQVLNAPVTSIALKKKKSEMALVGENGYLVMLDWQKNILLCSAVEVIGKVRSIAFNENEDVLAASVGFSIHIYDKALRKIKLNYNYESHQTNIRSYRGNAFLVDDVYEGKISPGILLEYDPKKKGVEPHNLPSPTAVRSGMQLESRIERDSACFYLYKDIPPATGELMGRDYYPSDNPPVKKWIFSLRNMGEKLISVAFLQPSASTIVNLRGVDNAWANIKLPTENTGIEILPQFGFAAPLKSMLFSNDGKYIVTVAESPSVKIWDIHTGLLIKEIKLPEFNVLRAVIHPILPLLVIWDRNYELHLIDLDKQILFKTVSYTKEKYSYTGDFDPQIEFMSIVGFNKNGTVFTIGYDDYAYGSYTPLELNIPTNDLINGKVNNMTWEEDVYWAMREYKDELTLYDRIVDSMKVFRYPKNTYSILQSDTIYYITNVSSGNSLSFKDSTYFLDHELTKPLPVRTGLIETDFFVKSNRTYAQEKNFIY